MLIPNVIDSNTMNSLNRNFEWNNKTVKNVKSVMKNIISRTEKCRTKKWSLQKPKNYVKSHAYCSTKLPAVMLYIYIYIRESMF